MPRAADFSERPVGAVLLRIVSRAQALLAELLRLSDRVPLVFYPSTDARFTSVLFDLRYLKAPELVEERIEASVDLVALDEEFRENYHPFVERFFLLFDGIVKYYNDISRYLEDLQEGVYIQSTVESVLENEEGRQLMVEALVLHGVILMLVEHRLSGPLREQLVIAYYRNRGSTDIPNFEAICLLCRSLPSPSPSGLRSVASFTQLLQGAPPPVLPSMLMLARPEELLARFTFPKHIVQTMIQQLLSDDLYHQIRHYPHPEHRSTALNGQASALYVLLLYIPQMLHSDQLAMRGIVDKFFRECWVLPIFLGFTVDLFQAWERFKAAKTALQSNLNPSTVSDLTQRHTSKVGVLLSELSAFLCEGVLTQDYLLINISKLLSCLRNCNVTLRWLLLHRTTASKKLRDAVVGSGQQQNSSIDTLLSLLMDTAALEFEVRQVYGDLLESKNHRWEQCRSHAADSAQELSEFFSGSKILSKKVIDENLQQWFHQLAAQVNTLDYLEPISAGRKIQYILAALEEVEQFHQIESSLQAKQFLSEIRNQLHEMVRILNVQENVLATVAVVSDATYAWGLMDTFTEKIHGRIRAEPLTVLKLQCLFIKLRSIMDIPLLRISQCNSLDLFSVSEYYSSELVAYVRVVLEIVPMTMFSILNDVIAAETKRLRELPGRLEKDSLREFAQLEERYNLAKATHQVAVFTQGILAMRKTFIGAIELDPRQLLEDGIRNQVVKEIASALHSILVFPAGKTTSFEDTLQELFSALNSQQKSMEYFQDYVRLHGLQTWQEEFTRIIDFNTEQECSTFLRRKVRDWESAFQTTAVPIPSYPAPDQDQSKSLNFMGRLVKKLLHMTHAGRSMFLAPMSAWFDADGKELVGLHTFTMLQASLGPAGMKGVDRLLSFKAVRTIEQILKILRDQVDDSFAKQLSIVEKALSPPSAIPDAGPAIYTDLCARIGTNQVWSSAVDMLAQIGQIQLLRSLIATQLRSASKVDSGLVSFGLEGLNKAVLADITNGNDTSSIKGQSMLQWEGNDKLFLELSEQLQICGLHSPISKLYVASYPPNYLALLLFFLTLSRLPKYVLDNHVGTLTSKLKKHALDCCPLIVGIGTVLQQFHPSHMTTYVQLLGQYIQTHVENSTMTTSLEKSAPELPLEVQNAAAWLLSLFKYVQIPQSLLDLCLPAPFLDRFKS
ncbi:unnamed protein product [Calypogeia fissa]